MKKLIAFLLLGLGLVSSQAATVSATPTAASTNSLLSSSSIIKQIVVANPSSAALTFRLIDAPSTDLTYTISSYTNFLTYTTNMSVTHVTSMGVTNTNTWTGQFSLSQTVAASTNDYASVWSYVVPAGESVTFTPISTMYVGFGLAYTNSTNANITITYDPSL